MENHDSPPRQATTHHHDEASMPSHSTMSAVQLIHAGVHRRPTGIRRMSYGTKTRGVRHTAIVDFQRLTYRDPATLIATEVCPHCKRQVVTHRFTTGDGQPIMTYHCPEHSDVVPMHSLVVRGDPPLQKIPSRNINDEHT